MADYYVHIEHLGTEQKVFAGCISGPLAPHLEGVILENARVTDAGKRLTKAQQKRGNRHAR